METRADLASYGYLTAGALYSALLIRLFSQIRANQQRSAASLVCLGAVAVTAVWSWCSLTAQHQSLVSIHILSDALDLVRYGLWFAFIALLLRGSIERSTFFATTTVMLSMVIVAGGCFVLADESLGWLNHWSVNQTKSYVWLGLSIAGLTLLEQLFRNAADDSRWKLKPLCLGLACIFVFDFYMHSEAVMLAQRPDARSVRGGVHALAVPLLLVASTRGADWSLKLRVSRSIAFHSTALVLAGAYLLFIAAIGYFVRYFGGDWGAALQVAFFSMALVVLVVLIASESVQARLRVFLGKHFFRYRFDYREEWLKFTALLSNRTSSEETGQVIIRGLANMVESPGAVLWSKGSGDAEFVQTAQWNLYTLPTQVLSESLFTQSLLETGRIVDLDERRLQAQTQDDAGVPAWLLNSHAAWLVLPLIASDELIGFVVLARARTIVDVDWEVAELMATAGRQAASFLLQIRATESLLETRKFDAFNRMSAFVVHDLKNIVAQLSLMLKNAKRLHNNPEFQRDMLETIENSLEKMRQLMLQLREGQTPAGLQSGVDLVAIVKRIEENTSKRGRTLEVQIADRLMTRGDEERIERVVGHVVQNALDATNSGHRVWLKLERISGQAKLEIGDTGHGMSREFIRTRLFKPFNTTKATGMGIGAYESFQYLKELGGTIHVDSEPGKGTVMTLLMPIFEVSRVWDFQWAGKP